MQHSHYIQEKMTSVILIIIKHCLMVLFNIRKKELEYKYYKHRGKLSLQLSIKKNETKKKKNETILKIYLI